MTFYQKLVQKCDEQGLNPVDVARSVGAPYQSISMWRNGSTPRPATIAKIGTRLGVSPVDLWPDDPSGEAPAGEAVQQPVAGADAASRPYSFVGYIKRRMEPWPRGVNAISEIVRLLPRSQQEVAYSLVVSLAISSRVEIPETLQLTDDDFLDTQAPAFR